MTESTSTKSIDTAYTPPTRDVTMLALASTVLRRRRLIIVAGFFGGVLGGVTGLLTTRTFTSSGSFLAQASDQGGASGLAAAASQLGIRVPPSNNGWSPALYAQVARSRSVLGPIAMDTVTVPEFNTHPVRVVDLLKIKGVNEEQRTALAVIKLARYVQTAEVKPLGTVSMTITTPWSTFSVELGRRVLKQLDAFNAQTRRSQATAEREFAEAQAKAAEKGLREAEQEMQVFLQSNRVIVAPHLRFEQDRLQGKVTLAQSVYTSMVQSREEARIREVRDTPVITVLEQPRVPLKSNGRGTLIKALAGALLGGLVGTLFVFLAEALRTMRAAGSSEADDFFAQLDQLKPSLARRSRA